MSDEITVEDDLKRLTREVTETFDAAARMLEHAMDARTPMQVQQLHAKLLPLMMILHKKGAELRGDDGGRPS